MKRQKSLTQIAIDNLIFTPTKKKPKPTPTESQVKTYYYSAHLQDVRWLRMRARKKHDKITQRSQRKRMSS